MSTLGYAPSLLAAELTLRRGESVRTAVHCVYDRGRLTAMLGGVGLRLAEWAADEGGGFALALAACA